jgi:hypothetical protein
VDHLRVCLRGQVRALLPVHLFQVSSVLLGEWLLAPIAPVF